METALSLRIDAVHLFVHSFVCLSIAKIRIPKRDFAAVAETWCW